MISPEVPSRSEIADLLPLAPFQQGLLAYALRHENDLCTAQVVLSVEGPLDGNALHAAGQALLDRHVNLRAAFVHEEVTRPVQVIACHAELPWRALDISGRGAGEADRLAEEELHRPFRLDCPPLLRMLLLCLGPNRHRVVLTHHAIVLDGWSIPLAVTDLFALYLQQQTELRLPKVTPYRRQLEWLAGQDVETAKAAWRATLRGLDGPTLLAPAGPPVPPRRSRLRLSEPLTRRLTEQARALRLTLNTIVQGAWGLVLAELTGRQDVVFGALASGRPPEVAQVDQMVGQFVNPLPVRLRIQPEEPVADMLAWLQEEQIELFPYQHLPLAELLPESAFDTLTVFESCPFDPASLPDASFGGLRLTEARYHSTTHYPVTLYAIPGDRLSFRLDHRPDMAGRDILHRLERVLTVIANAPQTPAGLVG